MSRGNSCVTGRSTPPKEPDCPLKEVLTLIGDKWSVQVLVALSGGPQRFTELERALDGISRRMLTLCLRNLQRHGLITRAVHPDSPPRVEYATTSLIDEIREPLKDLAAWANRNRSAIEAARLAYDSGGHLRERPTGT
ncbi:winged helix-turn-helix transcriptional regulator [Streptomyces griseorubiginosus]|uniref:winged helix-turn-helix transcriptional regulator n=1 Tax=Streptomyces griseorubiginosus TaxID=67304 RepID=UPI0011408E02|nr:helix-turn-helix domain-containing protein [Streptomyces griseorubiginosus]